MTNVRCTGAGADVDDTEREWQERRWAEEKALRHEELAQQQRLSLSATVVSAVSILVAAAGVIASILVASHNSREQQRQQARSERISSQQFEYNEIVTGLASRAAAVQTNSMRGLTEYVDDESNFESRRAQRVGVQDAIATLITFIEDESDVDGSSTLSNYQAPQPVVVSRAIQSLKALVNDRSLGRNAADVSRGNFHGVALSGLAPQGRFLAVGADFRRADLEDLTVRPGASFRFSFLTCARLNDARFKTADLTGADLTGADLTGADLSHVTGLTSQQIHGSILSGTKLPDGVSRDVATAWGVSSTRCVRIANHMTGMRAGQGFGSWHCPHTAAQARRYKDGISPEMEVADLMKVCRIRDR